MFLETEFEFVCFGSKMTSHKVEVFTQLFQWRLFFEKLGAAVNTPVDGSSLADDQTPERDVSAEWRHVSSKLTQVNALLHTLSGQLTGDEQTKKSRLGLAIWNAAVRLATLASTTKSLDSIKFLKVEAKRMIYPSEQKQRYILIL